MSFGFGSWSLRKHACQRKLACACRRGHDVYYVLHTDGIQFLTYTLHPDRPQCSITVYSVRCAYCNIKISLVLHHATHKVLHPAMHTELYPTYRQKDLSAATHALFYTIHTLHHTYCTIPYIQTDRPQRGPWQRFLVSLLYRRKPHIHTDIPQRGPGQMFPVSSAPDTISRTQPARGQVLAI